MTSARGERANESLTEH